MAIHLVRHTAPDIRPGILYGASNVPVHAAEFARRIPQIDAVLPAVALVVTSPLTRCRRLADFLSMHGGGRTVIVDPRLIERDLGRWTGKLWDDVPRDEARAFEADYLDHWPPPVMTDEGPVLRGLNVHPRLGAGESVRAMQTRVVQGLEAAREIAEERDLIIVSHAGPIAAMVAYWLRETLRHGIAPTPECGGVVRLDEDDGLRRATLVKLEAAVETTAA
ncbi:MAG: histidine phosphatase family protein [Proteobacteria bacterium]|nr:histidine phosphatase family protein [Pseudomonadota bacterium]